MNVKCLSPRRPGALGTSLAAVAAGMAMIGGCASSSGFGSGSARSADDTVASVEVVPVADVEWGALNPARGSAGPRAADLWGDRAADGATGFLVRFAEGFSSPPHIHNVTYRGVVIEGLVHNDDPEAANSWMPAGSYWTQPAGEVHITSAEGDGRMAYIEIQSGPYLVMPPEQATDTGERAINIHAGNMVWLDASTTNRIELSSRVRPEDGPRMTFLWGDPQDDAVSGSMVVLPAGFTATVRAADPSLRVVVVKGSPRLAGASLGPGSYVGAAGRDGARITFTASEDSWLYVRNEGRFTIEAAPAG